MTKEDKEQFDDLSKKVDKLLTFFESDPKNAHKGIGERLQDVEKSLTKINNKEFERRGKMTVYGAIGGFATVVLSFLVKYIVTKIGLIT